MASTHSWLIFIFVNFAVFFTETGTAPVGKSQTSETADDDDDLDDTALFNLEYERYLQEVVQVLESDEEFRAKLEKANPDDVKSGKIADELDFLHHEVRSKLNEIKRREIDRLRQAMIQEKRMDVDLLGHLNHTNIDTFEKEDLRKLILKTTKDLEELDKKRREEFKQYEMEKELTRKQKLANMTEEERQNVTKEWEAAEKRHKEHPDVKHPGSKAHLEQVWEEVNKLPKDSFDPHTFFNLYDFNNDGVLDIIEVEAILQNPAGKVYDQDNPDDDMREKEEEVARMREHVMKEIDRNKDGVISLEEFIAETKTQDFDTDEGWKTLDEEKVYTDEELKQFEEKWAKENGVPVQQLHPPSGQPPNQPGAVPQAYQAGQQQQQYQQYQYQPQMAPPNIPPQQQAQFQPQAGQIPNQQQQQYAYQPPPNQQYAYQPQQSAPGQSPPAPGQQVGSQAMQQPPPQQFQQQPPPPPQQQQQFQQQPVQPVQQVQPQQGTVPQAAQYNQNAGQQQQQLAAVPVPIQQQQQVPVASP